MRFVHFIFLVTIVAGCSGSGPVTLAQAVTPNTNGFQCARDLLAERRYTIIDGDAEVGYLHAQRARGNRNVATGNLGYDYLSVNITHRNGYPWIAVTASMLIDEQVGVIEVVSEVATAAQEAEREQPITINLESSGILQRGPSDEGLEDMGIVLDQCGVDDGAN